MNLLSLDQLVFFRGKAFSGVKIFAVGLDGVDLSLRQNYDGGWKSEQKVVITRGNCYVEYDEDFEPNYAKDSAQVFCVIIQINRFD